MQNVQEAFATTCETRGPSPGRASGHLVGPTVSDVMSRQYVTATPSDTLLSVMTAMSEKHAVCAIVIDGQSVLGILAQDAILEDISGGTDFHRVTVGQRISGPVQTVPPQTSILTVAKIMDDGVADCIPVIGDGHLLGVVTRKHLTRGLLSVYPLKSAGDLLTGRVATVDTGATAAEASDIMTAHRISCVVALHQHVPAGIVTAKDLLRRVVAAHRDPMTTQVVEIMSFPLISIPPTYSIFSTAKKMDALGLHSLVVLTGDRLHGIVTHQDVLPALQAELDWIAQAPPSLHGETPPPKRSLMDDLQKIQGYSECVLGPDNRT